MLQRRAAVNQFIIRQGGQIEINSRTFSETREGRTTSDLMCVCVLEGYVPNILKLGFFKNVGRKLCRRLFR